MYQCALTKNTLFYGDNLDILRQYVAAESIDLIYLDPPFNSNRKYNVLYKEESGTESTSQIKAFEDTWPWSYETEDQYQALMARDNKLGALLEALVGAMGRNQMTAYLVMMALRLVELHRVLKPTGSLYLHCDPTASHYLKLVLDLIFGAGNYRSEMVWRRTTAHGNAKQGAKKFEVNFDTIFCYSKGNTYTFNTIYEPFKEEQIEQQYNKIDEHGRRYRLVTPSAAKGGGDTAYEFHGVKPPQGRFWAYSKANMEKFYQEGKLYFSSSGQPYIKYFLDERPGVAIMAFWDDLKPMAPTSKERLGYPTQKPLALLERILQASSNPGDVVLDPFCGCGTTLHAAQQLGRAWLGIEKLPLALELIKSRLYARFKLEAEKDYGFLG